MGLMRRGAMVERAADGDAAGGVVADVAVVVGVDEVLGRVRRRQAEGLRRARRASGGGVDVEEGAGQDRAAVVDDPAEGDRGVFRRRPWAR